MKAIADLFGKTKDKGDEMDYTARFENHWTAEEDSLVAESYPIDVHPGPKVGTDQLTELAGLLGRSERATAQRWTTLRKRAGIAPSRVGSSKLRIKSNGTRRPWMGSETDDLLRLIPLDSDWPGVGHWRVLKLADEQQRTPQAIYDRWRLLGNGRRSGKEDVLTQVRSALQILRDIESKLAEEVT